MELGSGGLKFEYALEFWAWAFSYFILTIGMDSRSYFSYFAQGCRAIEW